jgi:hypothetical protein
MKYGIDPWETWDFTCSKCDWKGKGSALEVGEMIEEGCEELCPLCGEAVTKKWKRERLNSVDQLPGIEADYMAVTYEWPGSPRLKRTMQAVQLALEYGRPSFRDRVARANSRPMRRMHRSFGCRRIRRTLPGSNALQLSLVKNWKQRVLGRGPWSHVISPSPRNAGLGSVTWTVLHRHQRRRQLSL